VARPYIRCVALSEEIGDYPFLAQVEAVRDRIAFLLPPFPIEMLIK
jgi:hypothetical protein